MTTGDEDDLIRLAIERQLRASGHSVLRSVLYLVKDGVVTLFGTVPSYHMKQVAQSVVMKLHRVLRVENHCEVTRSWHGHGLDLRSTKSNE